MFVTEFYSIYLNESTASSDDIIDETKYFFVYNSKLLTHLIAFTIFTFVDILHSKQHQDKAVQHLTR